MVEHQGEVKFCTQSVWPVEITDRERLETMIGNLIDAFRNTSSVNQELLPKSQT